MGRRSSFARQAANLWQSQARLQHRLAVELGAVAAPVHLVDGIPIPLCCLSRAPSCRSFKGGAAYGYCAAKKQTYYGFQGHLLISATGVMTGCSLTPAHPSEPETWWDVVQTRGGFVIGDKGDRSAPPQQELRAVGVELETALRLNRHDPREPAWGGLRQRIRRLIETVIGQ